MGVEILVLGADERLFHQVGNRVRRGKQPPFTGKFVDDLALTAVNAADGGRGILRKAFMAGQIAAIDIENRANAQRNGQQAHGQGRKDTAEKRQDESEHAGVLY